MKKHSRYLLTLAVAFILALAIRVPAKASVTLSNFKQSTCTTNSVTLTWNLVASEAVTSCIVRTSDDLYSWSVNAYDCTAKLTVPANYAGYVRIYAYYGSGSSYAYGYTFCNAVPTAPKKSQFGIAGLLSSSNKVYIASARNNTTYHKTQVQLYKGNKLVKTTNFYSSSDWIPVTRGAGYQYRARFYCVNNDNGKTYCSNWSPWRGFILCKDVKIKVKSNTKGYKLVMKKATGVTKYVVSSSTSSDSGFKKAKTFNAKKKKSYTISVTKKYKKKKTNYIHIQPYLKLSHFKGTSDIIINGSTYIYK